jgi:phosphoglycolate phosphatase-like HAD superfamily hydrolase
MSIKHVLFDADGVIQSVPGGWFAAMEPYVGQRAQEFLDGVWQDEEPLMAGGGDYLPLLAARLAEYGAPASAEEVYHDVWHRIESDAESLALVRALRVSGYGVHLGTNQERLRAAHMRGRARSRAVGARAGTRRAVRAARQARGRHRAERADPVAALLLHFPDFGRGR